MITTMRQSELAEVNHSETKKNLLIAELKHLEWYKMANASALKAALKQARSLKNSNSKQNINQKPIVTDTSTLESKKREFIVQVDKQYNDNNKVHPSNQTELHINSLNRIRQKLESSQEIKLRTQQYREWRKDIERKKDFVLSGNQLENYKSLTETKLNNDRQILPDSLKQLSELEKRITALEINMVPPKQHDELIDKRLRTFKSHHSPLIRPTNTLKPMNQTGTPLRKLNRTEDASSRYQPKYGKHYLDKSRINKESLKFKMF